MCKRIIVDELEIGGLSHKDLVGIKSFCPEVSRRFAYGSRENPPIEKIRLVGIRCCQYNLGGYVNQEKLFKAAKEDGLELCPYHLPFHYAKEFFGKYDTFIFATQPGVVEEFTTTGGGIARNDGYLAVRSPNIFDWAQKTPYGSGIEFAFMQRL